MLVRFSNAKDLQNGNKIDSQINHSHHNIEGLLLEKGHKHS